MGYNDEQQKNNFRFDEQFVKMIETQAEQKVVISNLVEKVKDIKDMNSKEFDNLNKTLESLSVSVNGIKNNCISHKLIEDKNKETNETSSLVLGVKPDIIKGIVVLVIMIFAYFFGIPIPK
ncbi:MAG: hypothetical protein CVT92_02410 [Bacteroidetes bacterium HGW-Bacteroidetes-1]|jgi:predicted PurR-regulated permease PerM|nr:MAG: hypothetical protein CVT92_02410 [Bacteroidetes bacterium HGW-Bacteroidetes-1]